MDEISFDQDFCHFLMFRLTAAFYNARDNNFRYLWCDGILLPDDKQLTLANICQNKEILTRGWFGYDGQGPFWFTIKFGPKALKAYSEGLSLTDCVPGDETVNWIDVNMETRDVVLNLQ